MSELRLNTDGHIIKFGADNDVSLTHVADTGLLLNSTMKLQFNDASQFIQGSSATVLSIGATDEIDLTATAVDLNGTLNVSGVATFQATPVFPDGSLAVADLDIDGATDIGAAIVDADLFIIDDGAGGTNRKVTASRLKTYTAFNADAAQVFNESGADVDFRIEADDTTHMFFVDASEDKIGINQPSPLGILHVRGGGADFGGSIESTANLFVLDNSGHGGMTIGSGSAHTCTINFGDSEDSDIGSIVYNNSGNTMKLFVNAQSSVPNLELGNAYSTVVVGQAGGFSATAEGVSLATNANNMTVDSSSVLNINREGTDGLMVNLLADNTAEGNITSSGSTIQFNTFCGAHWGRLADNSAPTILRGTVIETISTMIDWYRVKFTIPEKRNDEGVVIRKKDESAYEEIELPDGKSVGDAIKYTHNGDECDGVIELQSNEQLPMTKVSDTEDSKAVYGVFSRWDNEPDDGVNDMNVAALGAFIIRVHKDETVSIGDLLSSKGDGTAKVQADDIMRSKTIAKVTSTNKTYTYDDGSYCVPCTLHCG
jgi:hypothetical protein